MRLITPPIISTLLVVGFLLTAPLAWSADTPQPIISIDSAIVNQQWQGHGADLTWTAGSLTATLEVTPPLGFCIVGQPQVHLIAVHDAAGVDLHLPHAPRNTNNASPTLNMQPTSFVEVHLLAPQAPFSGLRDFSGTCTLRLAHRQVKDAVMAPLSEWIAKPISLADDKSTEFTVIRGDDHLLYIEFNTAASERFSGLRLTTVHGDELMVDADNDSSDHEQETVTRPLPEDTPDDAILTLHFVGSGERCTVPFNFSPLVLPAAAAIAPLTPTPMNLGEPKAAPEQPVQATDGRF